MKVLVVMPTYGRMPYLNRAVASFLGQDYEDKHMLIINDNKHVRLNCHHDSITCMNLNKRILLPQKRNIGSTFGYYDLIMPYDDDDIMLPYRISNHVKEFVEHPEIKYFRNSSSYAVNNGVFGPGICSTNACAYKQSTWYEVGGYANDVNIGDDIEFWRKIPNKREIGETDQMDYVYNWAGVRYHTTYQPSNLEEIAYKQLEEMNLINKEYIIEPDWNEFMKFIKLDKMYKDTKTSINVSHPKEGVIEIKE